MASAGRRLARTGAVLAGALVVAAGACTVWNGVTVITPPIDAATDSRPPPVPEAAPDVTPPPAVSNYLSVADGARLCSLAAACPLLTNSLEISIGVPIDPDNFSLCMEWAAGPIPSTRAGFPVQQGVLQCVAQATSCAAADACSVLEDITANDPRCNIPPEAGNDSGTYCIDDGGTKIDCIGLFAQHCDEGQYTPGSTCHAGNDGLRYCTLGGLDAGCPGGSSCIGTFQDYCGIDGLHFRFNCATAGNACGYDDAGNTNCGEACQIVTAACSGNVAEVCDGAEQSTFDCAAMGGTCSSKENAVYCARPGDACTPLDPDVNVCAGTSVALCIGGVKSSFDCASISKACLPGTLPQTPHCG